MQTRKLLTTEQRMRQKLVAENMRLVTFALTKLRNAGHKFRWNEAVPVATDIYLRCAEMYDPAKGYRFSTYACNSMLMGTLGKMRYEKTKTFNILKDAAKKRKAKMLAMLSPDGDPSVPWQESDLLDCLTPKQRYCVGLHFWEGKTYRQISQIDGTSWQNIEQIVATAIGRIKAKVLKSPGDYGLPTPRELV